MSDSEWDRCIQYVRPVDHWLYAAPDNCQALQTTSSKGLLHQLDIGNRGESVTAPSHFYCDCSAVTVKKRHCEPRFTYSRINNITIFRMQTVLTATGSLIIHSVPKNVSLLFLQHLWFLLTNLNNFIIVTTGNDHHTYLDSNLPPHLNCVAHYLTEIVQ